MNSPEQRMRVGTWVRMEIPGQGTFVGFTYVDAQAGFSAKGELSGGPPDVATVTVRLPFGVPWEELAADEIAAQKLDNPPAWVAEFYGPQPPTGMEWVGGAITRSSKGGSFRTIRTTSKCSSTTADRVSRRTRRN